MSSPHIIMELLNVIADLTIQSIFTWKSKTNWLDIIKMHHELFLYKSSTLGLRLVI